MSDKDILNILYEMNEELSINPLFEFITVLTIIKTKINREQENLKKDENISINHLKKLTSLYSNLKEYMKINTSLFKYTTEEKFYKKCKTNKFVELDNKIKLIETDTTQISVEELGNLYECLNEILEIIEKTIFKKIKKNPKIMSKVMDSISQKTFKPENIKKEILIEIPVETPIKTQEYLQESSLKKKSIDDLFAEMRDVYAEINSIKDDFDTMVEQINKIKDDVEEKEKSILDRQDKISDFSNKDTSIESFIFVSNIISELDKIKIDTKKQIDTVKYLDIKLNEYFSNSEEIKVYVNTNYSSEDKSITINDFYSKNLETKKIIETLNKEVDELTISILDKISNADKTHIDNIDLLKTNLDEILNKIIISEETDYSEIKAIYSLKPRSILFIFNTFIKLLGEKKPVELEKIIKNIFLYLRVDNGFRYNGGLGIGSGKDVDFTLNELEEFKQGKSAKIPSNPHYYIENNKINTDGKLKLFQLFTIVLLKISINIYNIENSKSEENKDEKIFEVITKNFATIKKLINTYKFGELVYEDAIKKDSGQKLYIEKLETSKLPSLA